VALKEGNAWVITAAGPTTSSRQEPYQADLIRTLGLRAVIGKGGMGRKTLEALRTYGAVYLSAIGGAAQLYSSCIESALSADEVRGLRRAGMGVGSHGMHHRVWRRLSRAERHEELVVARDLLQEVLGEPVRTAACPLGRYDRATLTALRRLRYDRVYTSDRALARPGTWRQARFSLRAHDTADDVAGWLRHGDRYTTRLADSARTFVKGLR
jgi:peptidoglycan/xylan/chitin deacetylase (PgdA/CDA1 family)